MVAFPPNPLPHLTPSQRTVLELRYLRQASHAEIAQWLGISLRSVRFRLNQAHARLGIRPLCKRKTHKRTHNASEFQSRQIELDWL